MSDPESLERVSYRRPAALPGAELLSAEHSARGWHVFHERYAVCACRTADASWRYRGNEYGLQDHDVMLLEPGETHRNTWVAKPSDFKVMLIPVELFVDAARELGQPVAPHFRLALVDGFKSRLFSAVYQLGQAIESDATVLEQQSRFVVCVRLLLEQAERRPPQCPLGNAHRAVERAKIHLREHYAEPVTLAELSSLTGLSRFHLVHAFTRYAGLPPHAYQIHIRIERGRALLLDGIPPVEVASIVGFADQSHFNRHFKRIWRVTPGHYLRMAA